MELARYSLVLIICFILRGALGDFEVNLLEAIGLNTYSPVTLKDVRQVTGPKSRDRAYAFGSNTADQIIGGETFLTVMKGFNERRYNKDITVAAVFRLSHQALRKRNTIVSFTSASTAQNYLSITLRSQEIHGNVMEGQKIRPSSNSYATYVDIDFQNGNQYIQNGNQYIMESVPLENKIQIGNWTSLIVRVQNGTNLKVELNCKRIAEKQLLGAFPRIPSDSELRIAQNTELDFWTSQKRTANRFQGDIHKAQLLFGARAFKYLSPCSACKDSGMSVEGIGGTPDCVNNVADLRLGGRFIFFSRKCKLHGKEYNDGQKWKPNKCQNCTCKDGRIKCQSICKKCSSEGSVYPHGQNWTSHIDPCRRCSCDNGNLKCQVQLCRNTDKCRYGTVDIQGQCCPVCKEHHCAQQGRTFRCDCQRKCTDLDPNAACSGGCKLGCFCPPGMVENDEGKCVKPTGCTCNWNGNVYRFNQIHTINRCKVCICQHSRMRCFQFCRTWY